MKRVTLIGMNNPLHRDKDMALWPDPVGCTGWHLWKLASARTGCTRQEYVDAFCRVNLLSTRKWEPRLAEQGWRELESWVLANSDVVVLLGAAVRRAVLRDIPAPEIGFDGSLALLPHPSGLNRWYNGRVNRAMAEILMEELYALATEP